LKVGNGQLFRFYVLQTLRSQPTRSTMMTVVGLLTWPDITQETMKPLVKDRSIFSKNVQILCSVFGRYYRAFRIGM